jgi:putative CocE/NonD family hydrolase
MTMHNSFLTVVLFGLTCFSATAADEFDGVSVETLKIQMRDGTRLATDLYRPARSGKAVDSRFPVLITRSHTTRTAKRAGWLFARHGYVFVAQDCRGFFASDGDPVPFVREERTATTPSNGRPLGLGPTASWHHGSSYLALNQLAGAIEQPPHLQVMFAAVGPGNYYADAGYRGGVPGFDGRVAAEFHRTARTRVEAEAWLANTREKRAEVFADFPPEAGLLGVLPAPDLRRLLEAERVLARRH